MILPAKMLLQFKFQTGRRGKIVPGTVFIIVLDVSGVFPENS
jgi:hypothetical protein